MVMSVMKSLGLRAKLNAQKCSERVYQLDDTNATQRCNTLIYRNSWFFPVIPVGRHGDCRREWTPEDTSPNRAVRIIAKPSLAGREAFPAGTVANERIRRFAVTRKASRGVGFARHAGSPESWPGLSRLVPAIHALLAELPQERRGCPRRRGPRRVTRRGVSARA